MPFPRKILNTCIFVAPEALNIVDENAHAIVVLRERVLPLERDVGFEMMAVEVMDYGGRDERK